MMELKRPKVSNQFSVALTSIPKRKKLYRDQKGQRRRAPPLVTGGDGGRRAREEVQCAVGLTRDRLALLLCRDPSVVVVGGGARRTTVRDQPWAVDRRLYAHESEPGGGPVEVADDDLGSQPTIGFDDVGDALDLDEVHGEDQQGARIGAREPEELAPGGRDHV